MVESVDFILKNASEYFDKGDYKKAEPLLHQLVLKNVKSAKLFYMLGAIQYQKNDIKKALRSFKRSLEIDPNFTDSGIGLSVIYNDLGQYSEGQKRFVEVQERVSNHSPEENENQRKIKSQFVKKHMELAQMYNEQKNYAESLQQLIKAKSFDFNTEKVQIFIAECLLHLREYQRAVNELKSILQKKPNYVPALMRLAQIYSKLGHKEIAIRTYEQVLLHQPDHKLAHVKLTQIRALNPRLQGEEIHV